MPGDVDPDTARRFRHDDEPLTNIVDAVVSAPSGGENYSVWVASLTSDRPTGEEDEQGTAYIPAIAFASPAGQQGGRYKYALANRSGRRCGSADARRQARVNRMSIQGCQVSPSSVRSQKAVIV
jgi:hypothetical protein